MFFFNKGVIDHIYHIVVKAKHSQLYLSTARQGFDNLQGDEFEETVGSA